MIRQLATMVLGLLFVLALVQLVSQFPSQITITTPGCLPPLECSQ